MSATKKKLFVIIDPTSIRQIAFEKALLVASLSNSGIHAFICVYKELSEHDDFSSRKDLKLHVLDQARRQLDELMQRCSDNNIPFSTEIMWNLNWYEMATQAIAQSGCDLVFKSSFHHGKAKRIFSKTSDYYLMRYCSSPILFTHQSQQWQSSYLVACVDLESDDAEHMGLNNRIVKYAKLLSSILGMELRIVAVYKKGFSKVVLDLVAESSVGTKERLAEVFGVEADHILVRQGDTVETIHNISEEINASVMVIGSLARTGIAGQLIGNTAEKLLDIANADIITIS